MESVDPPHRPSDHGEIGEFSHETLRQAILVNWNELVTGMDHRAVLDRLIQAEVFELNSPTSPDLHYLGPERDAIDSSVILSQILLERIIAQRAPSLPLQKSAIQIFLEVLRQIDSERQSCLAALVADTVSGGSLSERFDSLRGFKFRTLSEQDLSELPDMAHLRIAPMSKSSVKFRSRIQELFRNGRFGVDGACSSDYALLPPESVADGKKYFPVRMTLLEGQRADYYLDDQFKTQLLEADGGSDSSVFIPLESVFAGREGQPPKNTCLLLGPPGAGKTMTALEALRQWAKCRMFTECKLAFYIPARALSEETKDVWELLQLNTPCYGLDESEMADVRQFVLENSTQVLLVVDGLDEVPEQMITGKSVLFQLLCGNPLTSCHILATARPCKHARSLLRLFDYKYQLLDLTEKQQDTVLQDHLNPTQCEEFRKQLTSQPQVKALMGNPLHMSLIIAMFKGQRSRHKRLPSGLCDVYGDVVTRALQRYVTRSITKNDDPALSAAVEREVQHRQDDHSSMPSVSKALREAEELALRGIFSQEYLFDVAKVAKEATESGLLVQWSISDSYKPADLGRSCQFIHLAIQEFLAARCIARKLKLFSIMDEAIEKIGLDSRRFNFWLCLSGMLDKNHLVRFLQKMFDLGKNGTYGEQKRATRLLLHSLAEVLVQQEASIPSPWRVRSESSNIKMFEVKFADVLCDGTLDLNHHQLSAVDFNVLCSLLSADNTLTTLDIESCQLDEQRCQQLASCKGLKKLETLHVGVNRNMSGPGLQCLLTQFSKRLYHLKALTIRGSAFPESDIPPICHFVKSTESLEKLYLHRTVSVLSTPSCKLLADAVRRNTSLQELICTGMQIDDEGATALSSAAASQGKIRRLYFRENKIGDAGGKACLIAAAKLRCERVDLCFNQLTENLLPELVKTLHDIQAPSRGGGRTPVFQLKLAGNHFDMDAVTMLPAMVRSASVVVDFGFASVTSQNLCTLSLDMDDVVSNGKYKHMRLTYLGMGDNYLEQVQDTLASLNTVHGLSMGHNMFTCQGMLTIAHVLRANPLIQVLDLRFNNIGLEGLETILGAIDEDGGNSTLRYLSLQGNRLVEEDMSEDRWERLEEALCRLVSECPKLELIGLHVTGIGDRGVKAVARSLPDRSALVWLNLNYNGISPTGVVSLCHSLSQNSSLRVLDLCGNQLNDDCVASLNAMQAARSARAARHIDSVSVGENNITGQARLGPGLLNGRLLFLYCTTILKLLDDYNASPE